MQELSSFTFQRWAFHRGGSRYLRHMAGIFQSRIVRNLAQPVLFAGSAALAVATYETLLQVGAGAWSAPPRGVLLHEVLLQVGAGALPGLDPRGCCLPGQC